MDPTSLYREEVFTDRKIGTIRVLTPVSSTGALDGTRAVLYSGETQLLTPGGLLPLVFDSMLLIFRLSGSPLPIDQLINHLAYLLAGVPPP